MEVVQILAKDKFMKELLNTDREGKDLVDNPDNKKVTDIWKEIANKMNEELATKKMPIEALIDLSLSFICKHECRG